MRPNSDQTGTPCHWSFGSHRWQAQPVTTETPATPPAPEYHKTFFGQPRQLATLFSVEMWERFSFYGMQGILLIYLYYSISDGGLGLDRVASTSIVGAYGGLVYLSTILGAWLADRIIGAGKDTVLRGRTGDVRAYRALADSRYHRRRRRAGADRVRQRRRQGQRHLTGRHAVFRRRSTTRRRLLDLLLRASTSAPSSDRC